MFTRRIYYYFSGIAINKNYHKKLEISQNSQESTCARVSFVTKFIKTILFKETLAQVFSYEFCEIFKNTFFHRTPLVAASGGFLRAA